MNELIKCGCGKRFPLNPDKHRRDNIVRCPWCSSENKNPYAEHGLPSFNLRWITQKLESWKNSREVNKFLREYGFKRFNPSTGKEIVTFSVANWKNGKRPPISRETVKTHLGPNTSEIEIDSEISQINELYKKKI